MSVGLVWAQARGGVIGAGGTLPWRLPEDSRHFRDLTMGQVVVMGRRTWDSLPPAYRPLPGRTNVVLSKQPGWTVDGAQTMSSVDGVLDAHPSCWVIGGSSVYAAFLPHADRLVVTEIDADVAGDTFAPAIGDGWLTAGRSPATGWDTSVTGLRYAVLDRVRAPGKS